MSSVLYFGSGFCLVRVHKRLKGLCVYFCEIQISNIFGV